MTFTLLHTVRNSARNLSSTLAVTAALGIGVGLVSGIPAQALRRDGKDDTAYNIKRVYKAGDTDRYRLNVKVNMDVAGTPIDMVEKFVMRETTREANDDGSYKVDVDFLSASLTANGMDLDLASMLPKVSTSVDKDGKADVKTEGGDEQFIAQMGDQIKQFTNAAKGFLPKKPVKVGDSWEVAASDFGAPGQSVKGKSTLVSIETIKGMKVGKIRSNMDVTGIMNSVVHTVTTSFIELATGKGISVESKTEGELLGGKMTMELTMKSLSPDEKDDAKETIKADAADKKP